MPKPVKPNKAPTAIVLSHPSVTENIAGAVIGVVKVSDPDDDTATVSVDDSRFEVVTMNGTMYLRLKSNQSLDYEASPSINLNLTATDSSGNSLTKAFAVSVINANDAPTAVSFLNAVPSLDENTAVGTGIKVADIAISDDALGTNILTLSGADAASFEIRNGNQLYFVGASPDYEAKSSYDITLNADDSTVGGTPDASQAFALAINNINEAPDLSAGAPSADLVEATSSSIGVATAVVHLTPSDPDGSTPYYDLSGWIDEGSGTYLKDGVYGSAVLDTNTNLLTYNLDNARAATEGLSSGDPPVIDSFAISVTDGSLNGSADVAFTIHGADDTVPQPTIIALTEPVSGLPGSTQTFWNSDGTQVFLLSSATLTADDTDVGGDDVFAVDLATGTKTLLSGSVAGGIEGNAYIGGLSPDGSKAVIQTDSSLTANDTDGGNDDAFLYNFSTGDKTLLSGPIVGGVEGYSVFEGFSPDGSKGIIQSAAALTADDSDGGRDDLFSYDFATGSKTLLTTPVAGGVDGYAYFSGLSPDGSKAIIASDSTLTADDTNAGSYDLFAYDLTSGEMTLLSGSVAGGVERYSYVAGWSPDSSALIIGSTSQLTVGDPGSDFGVDLFAYNFATGTKTLLTGAVAGGDEGDSYDAGWAAAGSKIIIGSSATLTANDTNGGDYDLFAFDFGTGQTTLLTGSMASGVEGTSYVAGISPDGGRMIIASSATLTGDDTNSSDSPDLFAYDFATGTTTLIAGDGAGAISRIAGWSEDGGKVIIQSSAALTPGDIDGGNTDVFAYDFTSGQMTLLTGSVAGGYDGYSDLVYSMPDWTPAWSNGGQSLEIVTDSTLSPNDLDNGGPDLYHVNLSTGAASLVDLGIQGVPGSQYWGEASSLGTATLIGVRNTATAYVLLAS
jgi:hypothetical protein